MSCQPISGQSWHTFELACGKLPQIVSKLVANPMLYHSKNGCSTFVSLKFGQNYMISRDGSAVLLSIILSLLNKLSMNYLNSNDVTKNLVNLSNAEGNILKRYSCRLSPIRSSWNVSWKRKCSFSDILPPKVPLLDLILVRFTVPMGMLENNVIHI